MESDMASAAADAAPPVPLSARAEAVLAIGVGANSFLGDILRTTAPAPATGNRGARNVMTTNDARLMRRKKQRAKSR